jgi:hypothetical protein
MAKAELKSFGKAEEVRPFPTFPFDLSFSRQPATLVSTRSPQEAL